MGVELKCKPCTSLQEREVDSFVTSSSDTRQLSLLNGTDTLVKSSENEQQTDGFQACTCGKETFDCSIHPSTPEVWIASMQDFLALILALPENKQALALRREVASTVKSSASLAWLDRNTCSWKTSQQSLITDSEPYSQTLPISGMLVNGQLYELPIVGRRTNETDGGACFPTPTAHDAKKGAYPSEYNRNTPGIAVMLGGKPSPMFQEWQMGWPINHTALKQLETDNSHCKPQLPGKSSEGHEC